MESTIRDPLLEKCQLQGRQYFHAQDLIPACRDHWHKVYLRKLSNMKILNSNRNNTIELIVIFIAQSCRLSREMIWNLCEKGNLLPSRYSISNDNINLGNGKTEKKAYVEGKEC